MQWARGTHDGYQRFGVTHDRCVEYDQQSRKLTIVDTFDGGGSHDLVWHWHLSPEVDSAWDSSRNCWVLTHKECAGKLIISGGEDSGWAVFKGSTQPILGWYSAVLGRKVPAETLRYRYTGQLPRALTFRVEFV